MINFVEIHQIQNIDTRISKMGIPKKLSINTSRIYRSVGSNRISATMDSNIRIINCNPDSIFLQAVKHHKSLQAVKHHKSVVPPARMSKSTFNHRFGVRWFCERWLCERFVGLTYRIEKNVLDNLSKNR